MLTVGWVGIRGGMAANAAFSAAGQVSRLGSLLAEDNVAGARLAIPAVQAKADEAQALTSDPIWRAVEYVPGIGGNLAAVRQSFTAFSGVASDGLGPLVELSEGRAEGLLAEGTADRRVSMVKLTPAFVSLNAALQTALTTVDEVDAGRTIPALGDAFTDARSTLRSYAAAADAAATLSAVVPSLQNADAAQDWTITITAEGEAIAVLLASTSEGDFVVTDSLTARSDSTPQPGAADALTVDTSALPYLLGRTGPIEVAGVGEVTVDTVGDITATGVYAQTPSAEDADALVGAIAGTLFARLLN